MRRGILCFIACGLLPLVPSGCQIREEEDRDAMKSRGEMARLLNGLRTTDPAEETDPVESLRSARPLWAEKVRPWMEGSAKASRNEAAQQSGPLREFYERLAARMESRIETVEREMGRIEEALVKGARVQDLDEAARSRVDDGIREIVWALSHQPEGFEAPEPTYTWKDWAIALGIGFGHLTIVLFVAVYLRRRYRRAVTSEAGGR